MTGTARTVDVTHFVDGQWIGGDLTEFRTNPAQPADLVSRAPDADEGVVSRAVDAAHSAAVAWGRLPAQSRGAILGEAGRVLSGRAVEIAELLAREEGKTLAEAAGEVDRAVMMLSFYAAQAWHPLGANLPSADERTHLYTTREPIGVVGLITPWNFPLAMATRKIAPALAAGCTVVIKPPALTPLTTMLFTTILEEAGLPAGVVNVVNSSSSSALSAPIIADPRLRKLSFTGSTGVGRKLIAQAAEGMLRVSMELGGNAPFVVFDDADLDKAVEGALQAKFRNIGQACTAANRFIVHDSVADEFARRVGERVAAMRIGRGTEDDVQIGPLIDDDAVAKASGLVSDAVERGARLVTGGSAIAGEGSFFEPTVIADVAPGSEILREEIFGPVLAIARFRDEDEAVRLANDTEYGLVSYVFTQDLARGHRMIDRLETGMMGLNVGVVSNAAAPFGGVKQSGVGREGGLEGIHEYLSTKYTLIPVD